MKYHVQTARESGAVPRSKMGLERDCCRKLTRDSTAAYMCRTEKQNTLSLRRIWVYSHSAERLCAAETVWPTRHTPAVGLVDHRTCSILGSFSGKISPDGRTNVCRKRDSPISARVGPPHPGSAKLWCEQQTGTTIRQGWHSFGGNSL